jgi:hypothetical protein
MSDYFKILGKIDLHQALAQFEPIIQHMNETGVDQFGLIGRVDSNGNLNFGEGVTRGKVNLQEWNHWRNDSYNSAWLRSFLDELSTRIVGRIRVMRVRPMSLAFNWHRDFTPRIHVPLITQSDNFMIIKNESMHLYRGVYWWTDTTKFHTAMNCSDRDRFHLVIEVSE